jgi:hypothetical protein
MIPKLRLEFDPLLVDINAAAAAFSVGPSEFWNGVKAGEYPPPVGFRGGRRWRLADLRKYVEAMPTVDPSERQSGRGRKASP